MEALPSSLHGMAPAGFRRPPRHPSLKPRGPIFVASASKGDAYGSYHGGRLVDENMIVLRKRIHETKMAERNYEPPTHWMEWEKRYYTSYDSDVCELMGIIQALMISTRPSVGVGMVVIFALSLLLANVCGLDFFSFDPSIGPLGSLHLVG